MPLRAPPPILARECSEIDGRVKSGSGLPCTLLCALLGLWHMLEPEQSRVRFGDLQFRARDVGPGLGLEPMYEIFPIRGLSDFKQPALNSHRLLNYR